MLNANVRVTTFLILACLAASCGCGGPDRPPTVKVSGRVTFQEQAPPATGKIYFNPVSIAEGLPRQPGSGSFDEQGNFQVTSYEEHDGLIPGNNAVKIECWKQASGYTNEREESYVPRNFEAPQLVVPADQEEVTFKVNMP